MRTINLKSLLIVGLLGSIAYKYFMKNGIAMGAEHKEPEPTRNDVRDLYGSVVLVDGEQSMKSLAYNQEGGYELDTIVSSLGQNSSGRVIG
jgi:hypothetical protein